MQQKSKINSTSKYGGCPWRQPNFNYGNGVIGLHEEIEHFYRYILPTPIEHAVHNMVIQRIEDVIQSLWPQAVVEVFGSFRTGLLMPNSDIDLVAIGLWNKRPLCTLEAELKRRNFVETDTIRVVASAAVPIIKFTDRETKIKVDLSFNMDKGVQSAELIKMFKRDYKSLGYLVMVLKQFIQQRDLHEVYTGGLSSYSLTLMCISFLQMHPRNICHDDTNLGVLLLEFFELYGLNFNYSQIGICIANGGSYVKTDFMSPFNNSWQLSIQDPLQPDNDIGRNSRALLLIRQSFQWAYRMLSQAVDSQNPNTTTSVLGHIIHINDKLIDYRKWLCERFDHLIVVESISLLHGKVNAAEYVTLSNGDVEQLIHLPRLANALQSSSGKENCPTTQPESGA